MNKIKFTFDAFSQFPLQFYLLILIILDISLIYLRN